MRCPHSNLRATITIVIACLVVLLVANMRSASSRMRGLSLSQLIQTASARSIAGRDDQSRMMKDLGLTLGKPRSSLIYLIMYEDERLGTNPPSITGPAKRSSERHKAQVKEYYLRHGHTPSLEYAQWPGSSTAGFHVDAITRHLWTDASRQFCLAVAPDSSLTMVARKDCGDLGGWAFEKGASLDDADTLPSALVWLGLGAIAEPEPRRCLTASLELAFHETRQKTRVGVAPCRDASHETSTATPRQLWHTVQAHTGDDGNNIITRRAAPPATKRMVNCISRYLESIGAAKECYIGWGTLLGQQRDGVLIPYDGDVDFGCSTTGLRRIGAALKNGTFFGVAPIVEPDCRSIIGFYEENESYYRILTKARHSLWRSMHAWTDIISWRSKDYKTKAVQDEYHRIQKVWQPLSKYAWPTAECTMSGIRTTCPRDPDAILTRQFTVRWRDPYRLWDEQNGEWVPVKASANLAQHGAMPFGGGHIWGRLPLPPAASMPAFTPTKAWERVWWSTTEGREHSVPKPFRGRLPWEPGSVMNVSLVTNPNMSRRPTTYGERRFANFQCLIALRDFLNRHDIPYWLGSGTAVGAYQSGRYIPWDEDADVDMKIEGWERVKEVLTVDKKNYQVPGPGCLLIDHESFQARKWLKGVTGRIIHDSLGYYNDIFTWGGKEGYYNHYVPTIPDAMLFPVRPCFLDGVEFACPHRLQEYVEHVYGVDSTLPRFRWDPEKTAFVDPVEGIGENNEARVELAKRATAATSVTLLLPPWDKSSFHLQLAGTNLCVSALAMNTSEYCHLVVCNDSRPEQLTRWIEVTQPAAVLPPATCTDLGGCECSWMEKALSHHRKSCPRGDGSKCYAECCCRLTKPADRPRKAFQAVMGGAGGSKALGGKVLRVGGGEVGKPICFTRISASGQISRVALRPCRTAAGTDAAAQTVSLLPHGFVRIGGQCLAAVPEAQPECDAASLDHCKCGWATEKTCETSKDDDRPCFTRCCCTLVYKLRKSQTVNYERFRGIANLVKLPDHHTFTGAKLVLVDCGLLQEHVRELGSLGDEQGKTGVVFAAVD